ncbi:hypothetical protein, partial [Methylocella sp.]|uniref:hypothetical protein n=1 Tax=Methylocella sp. TaxID=1978226 RepID=UPI003C1C43F7
QANTGASPMNRNIITQRLAMFMAAALAVGVVAADAQARGGGGHGGGGIAGGMHFGGGDLVGGGFHGGMMTGRSAVVPGGNRVYRHDFIGCCSPSYGFPQQDGCC